MPIWWLSFADSEKPRGSQFLGALIIRADNEFDIVPRAWMLGLNPGGEVRFFRIPKEYEHRVPPDWIESRLITKDECAALDRRFKDDPNVG